MLLILKVSYSLSPIYSVTYLSFLIMPVDASTGGITSILKISREAIRKD